VTGGAGREAQAVEEYWRIVRSAQRDEIVAEAEDVLSAAWAVELEEVRRATLRAAESAQTAYAAARTLAQVKRNEGSQRDAARAHDALEKAEAEQRRSLDAANALLTAVDDEFELMCQAAEEREAVCEGNRNRVRSAWKAAYGADMPEHRSEAGSEFGDEIAAGDGIGQADEAARRWRAEGREGLFWVEETEDPE
jgi:hypothetical protein